MKIVSSMMTIGTSKKSPLERKGAGLIGRCVFSESGLELPQVVPKLDIENDTFVLEIFSDPRQRKSLDMLNLKLEFSNPTLMPLLNELLKDCLANVCTRF